ncbi:hypothetical protein J6590_057630, partial [Homalodisca vitripennis]
MPARRYGPNALVSWSHHMWQSVPSALVMHSSSFKILWLNFGDTHISCDYQLSQEGGSNLRDELMLNKNELTADNSLFSSVVSRAERETDILQHVITVFSYLLKFTSLLRIETDYAHTT